ncbi:MAG: AraC family transcriptional regulator, partial [Bacteroidota bacterium]|nr:AraC family transcriptional regulator [Bacteroidota bacterium]
CYYVWENEQVGNEELIVESPPNAFTAIVFNYADEYYVSLKNKEIEPVPRQFIVGQLTHSYTLHFPGRIGTAAIVFKPTGIASIFGISMYALTEERTDLKAVLPCPVVETAVQQIQCATDAHAKAKYLEQFVLQFYAINQPKPDVIDMAANQIVEKHGQVSINELCSEFTIGRRQFERKFLQRVGLSP